ncbi:MAG: ATP-dependent zinc metalloprotease FtsH [Clostridia bacterium]|nr:ATP-dependent zinc metalloprotease FtsH [Clostridia bacterium]
MNKKTKQFSFSLLIVPVLVISVLALWWLSSQPKQVNYSQMLDLFYEEKVNSFYYKGNVIHMELKENVMLKDGTELPKEVPVTCPILSADLFVYDLGELIATQHREGILEEYNYVPASRNSLLGQLLPLILIVVLFGALWIFLMKQNNSNMNKSMSFGKARVKLGADEKHRVTFKDVAGADEEKQELMEIVEFLKSPQSFTAMGARIPKGVLLVGPPGTGKTLLAKAVAGEAGVPFFTISGSDFVEMYVGVGASRVRDLFDQAKRNAPSIVFIDEIDAVGRQRGAGLGGGHDEREQTLNQLLVEMDGFGVNEGVIVIAATNRHDILDPALLRAGRFDRQVAVEPPDMKGREEVLQVHAKGKPLAEDVKLGEIAKSTTGFTGADLENLLNEAALLAVRRGLDKIGMAEIEDSFIKVIVGPQKKSRVITEKEKKLTAYHEAGHAILTRYLPTQDRVHQISIIPTGFAGGYTLHRPAEDRSYRSKNEMFETVQVLLGGRVAEKLVLDDISTGASNDIQRATDIIRSMLMHYGMSDELGTVNYGGAHNEIFLGRDFATSRNFSEKYAAAIDDEIKKTSDRAFALDVELLTAHMDKLHAIAQYLLEHETMDAETFESYFTDKPEKEETAE